MIDVVPAGDAIQRDVVVLEVLRRRRHVTDVLVSCRSTAGVAFFSGRERLEAVMNLPRIDGHL
jgi:hypothetical protein